MGDGAGMQRCSEWEGDKACSDHGDGRGNLQVVMQWMAEEEDAVMQWMEVEAGTCMQWMRDEAGMLSCSGWEMGQACSDVVDGRWSRHAVMHWRGDATGASSVQ